MNFGVEDQKRVWSEQFRRRLETESTFLYAKGPNFRADRVGDKLLNINVIVRVQSGMSKWSGDLLKRIS